MIGLLLGALIGVGVGAAGGLLLRQTRRRGWSSEEFAGPAVLALSLLAYLSAVLAGANGFVAAFVGGIAFTLCAGRRPGIRRSTTSNRPVACRRWLPGCCSEH